MPLFWWALPWSDLTPGARGERVARWAVPAAEPLRGLLRGNAESPVPRLILAVTLIMVMTGSAFCSPSGCHAMVWYWWGDAGSTTAP